MPVIKRLLGLEANVHLPPAEADIGARMLVRPISLTAYEQTSGTRLATGLDAPVS